MHSGSIPSTEDQNLVRGSLLTMRGSLLTMRGSLLTMRGSLLTNRYVFQRDPAGKPGKGFSALGRGSMFSMLKKAATFAVVLLLATLNVWGQTHRGTVRGTVMDPAQLVVPGAQVVAVNVATGIRTSTITTGAGNYNIPGLTAGVYTVEVEAAGFKKLVRENIGVNAGAIVPLTLELELGAAVETVTVTAAAPQLEKETSDLKTTITPQAFADLPLQSDEGRNPAAFAVLVPGTKTGAPPGPSFFSTTFNGGQTLSGEVELDGLSVNYPPAGGQPDAISGIAPEAIREVSVTTGGHSAESIGSQGVQRYVIRSGTNDFHGNLYEFLRNEKLDANSYFANSGGQDRAPHRRNEFGGSVGGPIWIPGVWKGTDRSFFFVNVQRFRLRELPRASTITVPTVAFRGGDFSALKDARGELIRLYDPATTRADGQGGFMRDPFVGNIVPADRFSTVSKKVMAFIPDPDRPGIVNNFLGTSSSPFDKDSATFKIDHRLTSKHSLAVSFAIFDRQEGPGSIFGDPDGMNPSGEFALNHKTARLAYDWIISPTVVAHVSLGYNRRIRLTRWIGSRPWDVELGLTNLFEGNCAPPIVGMPPYAQMGRGGGDPQENDSPYRYLYSGGLSWVKGRHNLKFGGEFNFSGVNYLNPTGCGSFNFGPGQTGFPSPELLPLTGDSFASFLLGEVSSGSWRIQEIPFNQRHRYYGVYVQDDIKLKPNLTLNLGLRYDLGYPLFDEFDNNSMMDPSVPNPAAGGLPGALIFAGTGPGRVGRRRLIGGLDTNNFAPRIGLAWSLRPNLVIRAGAGRAYFVNYNNGAGQQAGNVVGFTTGGSISSPDGRTPAYQWDDIGFPLNIPRPPFIDPGYAVGQGVQRNYPNSHLLSFTDQWNFNVQYGFAEDWMLDVGYVGNKGNRLVKGRFDDNQLHTQFFSLGDLVNRPIDDPEVVARGFRPPYPGFVESFPVTPTLGQALRPFPQYTGIQPFFNQDGHHTYHSLQVKLQKQLSRGFFLLTSYTWSKKITDADSAWGFLSVDSRDKNNQALDKQLSPSNPPQRLTAAFTYELPIGPGKKFANVGGPAGKLIGGWQISGVLTYQTGFPIWFRCTSSCPNAVPGVDPLLFRGGRFDPAQDKYLDVNAFSVAPPFTIGDTQILPKTRDFAVLGEDFGIMKRTQITEKTALEFRFEMFDALNRHRFAPPNTSFPSPGFGTVGGTASRGPGSGRTTQLALKFVF